MAHIFIPDGVRVVIQGIGGSNQELINAIGVQVPGGGPASYADCVAIVNAVKGWWENTYHNMVGAAVGISQIVATGMASAPAPQAQATSTVAGVRTGQSLTDSLSLCVKLATNTTGRRHRGRFFSWPAVITDLLVPDAFTPAYVSAMQLALIDLGARIQTAGYTWAIASMTDARMYPVVRPVAVDRVVDTQKRRLITHGR